MYEKQIEEREGNVLRVMPKYPLAKSREAADSGSQFTLHIQHAGQMRPKPLCMESF